MCHLTTLLDLETSPEDRCHCVYPASLNDRKKILFLLSLNYFTVLLIMSPEIWWCVPMSMCVYLTNDPTFHLASVFKIP